MVIMAILYCSSYASLATSNASKGYFHTVPFQDVFKKHQEGSRRSPRGFKTHLIWLQDGLRRSKTHLRHYKTSNIDQLGRLGLMHKTTGVFMHKTMSTNCVCKGSRSLQYGSKRLKTLEDASKKLQNVYDVVIMLTRRSNMLPRGSKTLLIPVWSSLLID
jgi:hypothetical protein